MLRIILRGRTGNILFQYALGRVLAAKHGVPLVLGAHWYNREGWAEVSHFLKLPIRARVARGGIPGSIASRALRKVTKKHYWEHLGLPVLREDSYDHSFDPRFLDASADCVISGYFQTPRYFESMADELRGELNLLLSQYFEKDSGRDARATVARASRPPAIFQKLTQPNSIAVHVRRGDFLKIPVFQVCDEHYYRESMNQMRTRIPDAHFFIFSDDPEWCRATFIDPDTEVVAAITGRRSHRDADVAAITGRRSHRDADAATGDHRHNPLHDLHLMSLASHHIIANSSYSWWAAWLGDKPGQEVIMPDRWYAREITAPMAEKRWK